MPTHIHNPTAEDLTRILAVQQQCYHAGFQESAASFRVKLEVAAHTCWLASRGDKVLGYLIALPVSVQTFPMLNAASFDVCDDADLLYIHDLAITPAGRSLGLGRQLIERALAAATAADLSAAGLIAVQDSLAYWARYGFAQIDAMERDPAGGLLKKVASFGEDARYMEKTLP